MSLLIHSLSELSSIILPVLEIAGSRTVIEIGSETGGMTEHLAEFVKQKGGWMTSIDPAPSDRVVQMLSSSPYGSLNRDISVRALPNCPPADAYVVDGDHNYFTVAQELFLIEAIQASENKPFLALLHDVGWPCAYRDLYYNPSLIPAEWRQPFTWDRGLTLDSPATIVGGFRGCGVWACALHEGGERNGVAKAAEDFVRSRGDKLRMAVIPAVFGLGIMYDTAAPWAEALQAFLVPYDRNPLLAKLERNRLANYLRVIQYQDSLVEEPAHAH